MKAVLVIDVPKIDKSQINYISVSFGGVPHIISRDEITFKPLPQREETNGYEPFEVFMYREGWNRCLEAITGETE